MLTTVGMLAPAAPLLAQMITCSGVGMGLGFAIASRIPITGMLRWEIGDRYAHCRFASIGCCFPQFCWTGCNANMYCRIHGNIQLHCV